MTTGTQERTQERTQEEALELRSKWIAQTIEYGTNEPPWHEGVFGMPSITTMVANGYVEGEGQAPEQHEGVFGIDGLIYAFSMVECTLKDTSTTDKRILEYARHTRKYIEDTDKFAIKRFSFGGGNDNQGYVRLVATTVAIAKGLING